MTFLSGAALAVGIVLIAEGYVLIWLQGKQADRIDETVDRVDMLAAAMLAGTKPRPVPGPSTQPAAKVLLDSIQTGRHHAVTTGGTDGE